MKALFDLLVARRHGNEANGKSVGGVKRPEPLVYVGREPNFVTLIALKQIDKRLSLRLVLTNEGPNCSLFSLVPLNLSGFGNVPFPHHFVNTGDAPCAIPAICIKAGVVGRNPTLRTHLQRWKYSY
jgi:hypothetical protein